MHQWRLPLRRPTGKESRSDCIWPGGWGKAGSFAASSRSLQMNAYQITDEKKDLCKGLFSDLVPEGDPNYSVFPWLLTMFFARDTAGDTRCLLLRAFYPFSAFRSGCPHKSGRFSFAPLDERSHSAY